MAEAGLRTACLKQFRSPSAHQPAAHKQGPSENGDEEADVDKHAGPSGDPTAMFIGRIFSQPVIKLSDVVAGYDSLGFLPRSLPES